MILTPGNEFCVVPDACVLLPMPLCDTLLRSAEEPSFFRIVCSEEILNEVRKGLLSEKFGYSTEQADRRIRSMRAAFPEAMTIVPAGLIEGIERIPDPSDRHVVALTLQARADMIVPDNLKHFPLKSSMTITFKFLRQMTS